MIALTLIEQTIGLSRFRADRMIATVEVLDPRSQDWLRLHEAADEGVGEQLLFWEARINEQEPTHPAPVNTAGMSAYAQSLLANIDESRWQRIKQWVRRNWGKILALTGIVGGGYLLHHKGYLKGALDWMKTPGRPSTGISGSGTAAGVKELSYTEILYKAFNTGTFNEFTDFLAKLSRDPAMRTKAQHIVDVLAKGLDETKPTPSAGTP